MSLKIKQFIKFCIVGLSNTGISLIAYYGCLFLGAHYILANVVSWIVGVFNSFYWNNKYVFTSTEAWWKALLKSYASYGFSLVAGLLLLSLLIEVLSISEFIAPIIVMIVMTPINFIMNKMWVFGKGQE